jgi:hypothetical protein
MKFYINLLNSRHFSPPLSPWLLRTTEALHGLGRQTFDIIRVGCTVWGDEAHDLERQGARFGETGCTAWADQTHDLKRQVARFGETMRLDFSSEISNLTLVDKDTRAQ